MKSETETVCNGILRVCCADAANLKVIVSTPSMTVRQCQVCERKHYEATADPGVMFARER